MANLNQDRFVRLLKDQINKQGTYAPLKTKDCRFEPRSFDGRRPDFEMTLWWRDREVSFVAETETRSSPRYVKDALRDLKERWADQANRAEDALLALPFISSSVVELFEETGLSGVDLNGNYVLQTDDFVAIRLDQENRYKESGGIKNVFRGTSSLVCRYLLHEPSPHEGVSQIHEGIQDFDGRASLSTVSKVLSTLSDELIVEKGDRIRVLQPEKLLTSLRDQYRPPETVESVPLNLPEDRAERETLLTELLSGVLWVWSGETSAERYVTTTPSQEDDAYTRELPLDDDRIDTYRDQRFYNCILHESREDFLYFGHDGHWASEVQTYLDLMQGDKREREIALDLKNRILNRFDASTTDGDI